MKQIIHPPNDFCHSLLVCSGLDHIEQLNLTLQFIVDRGLGHELCSFIEEHMAICKEEAD
jgi:hypothetical protein